jgi:hypothetical protein
VAPSYEYGEKGYRHLAQLVKQIETGAGQEAA